MKATAIIGYNVTVDIEAENYKDAVRRASDIARKLTERTGVPMTVEQVNIDEREDED